MTNVFGGRLRTMLAPPRYLAQPLSGIDISTSGVKAVNLVAGPHGLILDKYAQVELPLGVCTDGELIEKDSIAEAVSAAAKKTDISQTNVALPESKSYLFEAKVAGNRRPEWRIAIEQRLDELVPIPPSETSFDIVPIGQNKGGETVVSGIAFAHRIVDDTLFVLEKASIRVQALEGETFAMARALLPTNDQSTSLIIDIGKTTTKMTVVTNRIPRYATTIGIGGGALTHAVQKYFGVTEAEAQKVKTERGIVPSPGNEDYIATMLSTVSAIRDEIARRLEYWQDKNKISDTHAPVSHAILAGGSASIRGLPEYLEGSLGIPVTAGDVFTNMASRDTWIPTIDYAESLAYATTIGLALRDAIDQND